jgi:hypothetical protein
MNTTEIEIGVALLITWVVTLVLLLKFVDRPGHAGIIKGQLVVEHFLLAHILLLIVGLSLAIKGSGLF